MCLVIVDKCYNDVVNITLNTYFMFCDKIVVLYVIIYVDVAYVI